jgi:glycosyltransferase involved in cell wall biosynthesis
MSRILYIVPADYDALKAKGVDSMIFDRDERGFFERVVTVHPASDRSRIIEFNDVFVLHELGLDIFGSMARSRLMRIAISPFQLIRAVSAIFKLVHSEKIDIIRANDPFWMGLIGLIAARLTGRPLCVSIHADYDKREELKGPGETYTFFGLRWPARLVCRLVLSSADLVLPIRKSLGEWAISNGADRCRVRVIPHGVNMADLESFEKIDLYSKFNIPPGRKIISFVGRLSSENYIADIIESVRRLAVYRNDFCLIIAGSGELETWLKKLLADEPCLGAVIRYVGFQPRNLCFALRQKSTVSLCLMGGFSLIEACLARSPVISYDVEWHGELVQTDYTGFLLPERDINSVVCAIEQCLNESGMTAKLGEHAYKLALSRHDHRNSTQIKRKCYEELL